MAKKHSKPPKPAKSQAQREQEIDKIMTNLLDIGFPIEILQPFIKLCKIFVETGEGCSGKIKMNGFERILEYTLSKQPHIESRVVLKYDKNI